MITSSIKRLREFKVKNLESHKILPLLFLIIALGIRLLHALLGKGVHEEIWSDMQGYVSIADSILNHKWEPFHFFQSIGYPLLIALVKIMAKNWSDVLGILQALASFFTLYFMYKTTRAWFGKKVGLISLCIGAFHLPWILAIGYALPETFFALFLALVGWFSMKLVTTDEKSVLYSLGWIFSFVAALWLKGTHVFIGPLFMIGLFYYKGKKALLPLTIIGFFMSLSLAAHGLMTYKTIGKVQLSASAGGLNFVEGKCPSKRNTDGLGYSWQSPLFYQLHLDTSKQWEHPFWESGHYMKEGLKCIRNNPAILILSFEGIPYLFYGNNIWPFNQKPYADYVRFYELILSAFFIVGLFSYGKGFFYSRVSLQEVLVWVLPVFSLFLCVYIFKSEVRFRIPFDTWFIPLSVVGWLSFLKSPSAPLNSPQTRSSSY